MATSVRWPLQRTGSGGAARTQTPQECLAQIIRLSMVPGRSAHPWHLRDGIGMMGEDYDVVAGGLTGSTKDFIVRRFRDLERGERARLDGDPVVEVDGGLRRILLNYFDLETRVGRTEEIENA